MLLIKRQSFPYQRKSHYIIIISFIIPGFFSFNFQVWRRYYDAHGSHIHSKSENIFKLFSIVQMQLVGHSTVVGYFFNMVELHYPVPAG